MLWLDTRPFSFFFPASFPIFFLFFLVVGCANAMLWICLLIDHLATVSFHLPHARRRMRM